MNREQTKQLFTAVVAFLVGAALALLVTGIGSNSDSAPTARAVARATTPSQQDALNGLSTAQQYIQAHPNSPTPITSPSATKSASPTPSSSPTSTTSTSAYLSGLPWSDGGWFENDGSEATSFQAWRGRHVDNIDVYNDRSTWSSMLDDGWVSGLPSDFNATTDDLMISIPMWPDSGSVSNIGTDAQWKQLAQQIVAKDPNAVVRLGWEMNCCYSQATNANAAQWKKDWTQIWTDMKAVGPKLQFAFSINEGTSGSGYISDPSTLFIPGQMDMILMDSYDGYAPYTTASSQNNHQTKQFGWDWWYNFAQSKGVPFGLSEWGVWHIGSDGGNDDPTFINWVYNWLSAKAAAKPGSIRLVSYFNYSQDTDQELFPGNLNPNSTAAYKAVMGSLGK